ncbi:hypothetical protein [uncultured virus]|uniref:Uncharacterized protein n=1 Tax=uncultured virus TaxID=340016 RepID=A0A218MKJ2_9VIRU|nr:hypothetical protein [uncultured virus]
MKIVDRLCTLVVYCGALCAGGYIVYVLGVAIINTACNGCVVTWYRAKVEAEFKANYIPPQIEEETDDWEDDEDSSFD